MPYMPRLPLPQCEIEYLEYGEPGNPLALCVHGFPDHAPTFSQLAAALSDLGYHVAVPWLPGYFPSSLRLDGACAAHHFGSLKPVVSSRRASIRIDSVLIGHDWGALIGHAIVASWPERFRSFVAMAVPHQASLIETFLNSADQLQRSWYLFVFQSPLAETAVAANDYAFIDKLWREWSPMTELPKTHVEALKSAFTEPGYLSAALAYYRSMLGTPPPLEQYAALDAAAFGPIEVPTLYLHGTNDGCMDVGMANEAALAPHYRNGLTMERVDDAGHFLHLDQPGHVTARIIEFLGDADVSGD